MNPRDCGFSHPPAAGTADREEMDRFAEFLRQVTTRGKDAVLADPEWAAYIAGQETTQ